MGLEENVGFILSSYVSLLMHWPFKLVENVLGKKKKNKDLEVIEKVYFTQASDQMTRIDTKQKFGETQRKGEDREKNQKKD